MKSNCHYVIIGAGASGSVIANRLSENPDIQVVLLEAGEWTQSADVLDLGGFVKSWGSSIDWAIPTTPQASMGDRALTINQGKLVGGSTSINAMMYVRGNAANFDQWQEMGADGWSYKEVLPFFKKIESYEGGASAYRSTGGELSIRDCPDEVMKSNEFLNGAVELGYDGPNWDYNGERQENGAGLLQFHITADGKRASAATAFLQPVMNRPNLTIITGAEVTQILISEGQAYAVKYQKNGRTEQIYASKEIVVSAGTLNTPKILMLSGIGPTEQLLKFGIQVQLDLPGVGQNLQDHVQLPVIFKANVERPMTQLLTGNAIFVRTKDNAVAPDLQLNFTPSIPEPLSPLLPDFGGNVCLFLPILVQPKSVGEVKLKSNNPSDTLLVNPNYLHEEADMEVFRKAVVLIRKLSKTKAFSVLNGGEIAPGDGNIDQYIRSQSSTLWHPTGTCKMGNDPMSVVDSRLRIKRIAGLRVADASVMPNITSGNTVAVCFMIGEKAADMILNDAKVGLLEDN